MDIGKKAVPEYREIEKGHFCACHLYNTEEDDIRLLNEAKELEEKEAERQAKLLKNRIKAKLFNKSAEPSEEFEVKPEEESEIKKEEENVS